MQWKFGFDFRSRAVSPEVHQTHIGSALIVYVVYNMEHWNTYPLVAITIFSEQSPVFQFPYFPYLLTILSLSTQGIQIKIRAKISVLKGPGWCAQNGQTPECGSMYTFRTQRQPSQVRSGKGGARLSQRRHIFHIACINGDILQLLSFFKICVAAWREGFTVQSGMFQAGDKPWLKSRS